MNKVPNDVSITNKSPAFGLSSNQSEKDLKLVDKDPNLDKDINIKKPISQKPNLSFVPEANESLQIKETSVTQTDDKPKETGNSFSLLASKPSLFNPSTANTSLSFLNSSKDKAKDENANNKEDSTQKQETDQVK